MNVETLYKCAGMGLEKNEVHLELNLERDVKGNKMGFYSSKRKTRDPRLSRARNLMVLEKMEVLKMPSSQSTDKTGLQESQVPEISRKVWSR